MNLRVTPSFNSKINTTTPQNNNNRSVKFHSQPMADTVSFKANPVKFVHNSFEVKLPGKEVLSALLERNKDIFTKVGQFNKADDYYIEDRWSALAKFSRSSDELREMVRKFEQRRHDAHVDIVKNANVGTINDPVVNADGSTGFNKFIHDLLDWKKDFPLVAIAETDGHYPPELIFCIPPDEGRHTLTGSLIEDGAEFLKETNPQLAKYLDEWIFSRIGNTVEHKGMTYVVSPIDRHVSGEFVTTGIHYAPATLIK